MFSETSKHVEFSDSANRAGKAKISSIVGLLDLLALSLVRPIIGLLRILPNRLALLLSRAILQLFMICIPRLRKVGLRNLSLIFPEKSAEERHRILKASLWVFSSNLVAFAKIPDLNPDMVSELADFQVSKQLMQDIHARFKGVGALIATLHFGNFELFLQLQTFHNRPIAFLARGYGLPRLDHWWTKRRETFGNQGFGRKGGFAEIVHRLNNGQDVAVLFDQNVKKNHAIFVDLFGLPAATTKALGLAAIRTRCPIVFVALLEPTKGRYEVIATEVRNPVDDAGSIDERVATLMQDLHRLIEETVRKYPEQWLWIHRRFKTRPPGMAEDIYC